MQAGSFITLAVHVCAQQFRNLTVNLPEIDWNKTLISLLTTVLVSNFVPHDDVRFYFRAF